MDAKAAASSLESLMFASQISKNLSLPETIFHTFNDLTDVCLVDYPQSSQVNPGKVMPDLANIDATVKAMEFQVQAIKDRIREEKNVIPKAKKLVELSLHQQKKLQRMLACLPTPRANLAVSNGGECSVVKEQLVNDVKSLKIEDDPAPQKEKKGRCQAPRWYIRNDELDSLSSYMRGRLTLDKINAAITEMAVYAEANMQLIAAPRKKLSEDALERALVGTMELRDIGASDTVKGRYFFLETDMKGSGLKLDNTGKAILTVLRHLGRIQEARIGHHRVIILTKHQ